MVYGKIVATIAREVSPGDYRALHADVITDIELLCAETAAATLAHCLPKTLGRLQATVFIRHAGGTRNCQLRVAFIDCLNAAIPCIGGQFLGLFCNHRMLAPCGS